MYRLTLFDNPEQIENLKKGGSWPFECGGVLFTEETIHECDDLSPFRADTRIPMPSPIDPRLVVEEE